MRHIQEKESVLKKSDSIKENEDRNPGQKKSGQTEP
jgi:hypothetical protein